MKNNWLLILQGIFAVVVGVVIIVFPIKSLVLLTWLAGAFLFIESILLICSGIFDKRVHFLSVALEGVIGIVMGLVILYWPSMTFQLLILFFALWSILTGVIQIFRANAEKYGSEVTSVVVFSGLFRFLFGMLLLVFPQITLAISQILFGLTIVVMGLGSLIMVAKNR